MYSYTLYNNDCVLDKTTNTIIYKEDSEWKLYEKWKKDNAEAAEHAWASKHNLLLWNKGEPILKDGVKSYYDKDGFLIKKETTNKIDYYNADVIYKTEHIENDRIVLTKKYSENKILYEEKNFKLKTHKEFDIGTGSIVYYKKTKGDLEYEVWYDNKIVIKSFLRKLDKILKFTEYFTGMNSVSKKLHYSNNNMYKCTTYYTSGQVRGCGLISNDDKMQGEWIFYHHNNEVESKHNFSDGKLICKSFLFYENGKLYKEVNHD